MILIQKGYIGPFQLSFMSKDDYSKLLKLVGKKVTFEYSPDDWSRTGIIFSRHKGLAHLIYFAEEDGRKIEEVFVTGCPKIKKKSGVYELKKPVREYGLNVYYSEGPTAEEHELRRRELERVLG